MRTTSVSSLLGAVLSVASLSLMLAAPGAIGASADEQPLYQRVETPPAPTLNVAQALAAFRIAPGFHIEPVAAEPLIEDPIAFTWDEAGNLYVTEMRAYMNDTYGTGQKAPTGSVVRLRDTDGDGVFDVREMMLDGLVLPRAVAVVNDGLLIAEPPTLWLCPSPTGRAVDISCANKRKVDNYGDQPGSVEHAENGLLQGLDNWLYNAKSNRRLRLVDGVVKAQPTLFRGQWGIAKDNEGRLFYNTNSNLLSGDLYSAQSLVAAGGSSSAASAAGLNERISRDDALYAIRVNTGVNRAYVPGVLREDGRLNKPTSASGMAVNRGLGLGTDSLRDIFVAEPAANAIVRLVLQSDAESTLMLSATHARYPDPNWQQREFLASTDERFRPVSLGFGPDGALYVLDFYRGIIQDHVFISEQLRAQVEARQLARPPGMGRIWRIVADRAVAAGKPGFDLGAQSNATLVETLGHSNGWQRDTAQRLLLARTDSDVRRLLIAALRDKRSKRAQPVAALEPTDWRQVHALWTLAGRDELTRALALAAARSDNAELARQELQAGANLFRARDVLALLDVRKADARYQQAAIDLLALHNASKPIRQRLLRLLQTSADNPYQLAALRAAARGQETKILLALRPTATSTGWNTELEEPTQLLEKLAQQLLHGQAMTGVSQNPHDLRPLLDALAHTEANQINWSKAILRGLFAATRSNDFARIELAQSHALFAQSDPVSLVGADLWPAIARARQAFTWPDDQLLAELRPLTADQERRRVLGEAYFLSRCATCHGADGAGISGLAPELAASPWLHGNTERLVRVLLHGLRGPIEVNGTIWDSVMPGHSGVAEFSDEVASGLLTYLHRSWGHRGRPIEPEFVANIRSATQNRDQPWSAEELAGINHNTHFRDYEGAYGAGFVLKFVYNGTGLDVATGIFNGSLEFLREDHFEFTPRKIRFEFERDDNGLVQAVWMQGAEGPPRRVPKNPSAN